METAKCYNLDGEIGRNYKMATCNGELRYSGDCSPQYECVTDTSCSSGKAKYYAQYQNFCCFNPTFCDCYWKDSFYSGCC